MTEDTNMQKRAEGLPETVLDAPETVLDDGLAPILPAEDISFDATTAAATEGRMAAGAASETFTLHVHERIGSGSQGVVVRATDSAGREYAAKVSHLGHAAKDRRTRKAVLDYLVSLMDDHPLGEGHFKQTHLMPVYAYGKVDVATESERECEVVIMSLADGNLDVQGGCTYDELRERVIPQTAAGIRNLHVQGIVHRDIKPKNLYMLDGSIVLGDYGISSLLDTGRDTGATVFDKRTPGYSPHSSVIQRENDWYALGYTIWTLYNGGVHPHQALIDAGDLSAVLAGKQPVKFVPRSPEDATLGDLIYGLTLESSRGRLGYDDVLEWLDDPASFKFESPFDAASKAQGYKFEGETYEHAGELADAMAASWEDAKDHIYSGMAEDYFKGQGEHDLAVDLHKIVSDDDVARRDRNFGVALALTSMKASDRAFVWQGRWQERAGVADRLFASFSAEPYLFYRNCSDAEIVEDALKMLAVAYSGDAGDPGKEAIARASLQDMSQGSSDAMLTGDKMITVFDVLCDDKAAVRRFYLDFGMYGDAVCAKRNIDAYNGRTDEARQAIRELRAFALPDVNRVTLEGMRAVLGRLDSKASSVFALLPANPFDRMLGVSETGSVAVSDAKAYRCAKAYGQTCSIGFAMSVVAPDARESVCDYEGLRSQAASAAEREAEALKRKAEGYEASRTVDGHSKLWHVFLMACTIGLIYYGLGIIDGVSDVCRGAYVTYAPSMRAGGGFSPEVPVFGTLCDASLALVLCSFVVSCACVLAMRLLQLIPVAFASLVKKHALSVANAALADVRALQSQPLDKSISDLLRGKVAGNAANLSSASSQLDGEGKQFARALRAVGIVYKVAFLALMLGMVGSVIESLPFILFEGTISGNLEVLPIVLPTTQLTLVVSAAIYDAIVIKASGFKPNAIAVAFAMMPWIFFCMVLQGWTI